MNAETALTRRQLMIAGAGAALTLSLPIELAAASPSKIQVFKTPTCGCCKMWVEHLTASGFKVEAEDLAELEAVKQMAGVPDHLLSCHTGIVEGYTIEGHVPAAAIEKLLAERPPIKGLAVPGMPAGSPGMPSPTPERYDVVAFGAAPDEVFMSFVETDPV
ncbi:MAG: DUF411 domain-containing protein [Alphaproteobacteria bacterium]